MDRSDNGFKVKRVSKLELDDFYCVLDKQHTHNNLNQEFNNILCLMGVFTFQTNFFNNHPRDLKIWYYIM